MKIRKENNKELSLLLTILTYSRYFSFRNQDRKSGRKLKKRYFLEGEFTYSH